MTILQSLARYYDRLPNVAAPGWAPVKYGWCIVLNAAGEPIDLEDLRDLIGKKPKLKEYLVPWSDDVAKRTSGIVANFLTDKTAYVLGRTAGEDKRTAKEHQAFRALHNRVLKSQEDQGLSALLRFLEKWTPDQLETLPRFIPEMLDGNVMFRLEGDRCYLHERPAAISLIANPRGEDGQESPQGFCLISGSYRPIARLHRSIKGVEGAQSSGAPLVSCNSSESPAFSSFGKGQGLLSPTGEAAAFCYATALNQLLTRDGPNRLRRPIGDATVVFWADARDAKAAEAADELFAGWMDNDVTDEKEAEKVRAEMGQVAAGRPVAKLSADLNENTVFHILGLSPNVARLSVRFWLTNNFAHFAGVLLRHYQDTTIMPAPRGWLKPTVQRILIEMAVPDNVKRPNCSRLDLTKADKYLFDNHRLLAGEVMRAVLTGTRYPQTLLAAALIRLRAGDNAASGWHAAVIRAVLVRQSRGDPEIPEPGETPMSLQREYEDPGYQLGRLFAVYELAQRSALGRVNASIRDKYFGAASATPASVFPIIVRGGQNHLAKVRKEKPGWAALIEKELEEIHSHLDPALPRSLGLQKQGEFAIGYYHQRAAKLSNDKGEELDPAALADTTDSEEEA